MSEDGDDLDLGRLLRQHPVGGAAVRPEDFDGIQGESCAAPPASSEHVLDLDGWGKHRGERIAQEWLEAEIAAHTPEVVADAHAALFEISPQLADNPKDVSRSKWWGQMMETPEYRSLRKSTCLEPNLSSLGAKQLCDQWVEYESREKRPGGPGGDGRGGPCDGRGGDSIEEEIERIGSTQEALDKAKEEVSSGKDAMAGLGMGSAGNPISQADLAQAFKRLRSSDLLRKILSRAGRYRSRCRSLQKNKLTAPRGEITGLEFGGNVETATPMEQAMVAGAVPETEDMALLRLAQRRLLCYSHREQYPVAAGPIVVCVDESGSMDGQNIVDAKGIAATMAWLAREQHRWCALVGYSGSEIGTRLALPPDRWDQQALLDWLEHFYGGGTTMEVPLEQLPSRYWEKFVGQGMARGKTDVVLITDAIVSVPSSMEASYKAWAKEERVKTYGIILSTHGPGDLRKVCDRYWVLQSLDIDSAAVEELLSI